MSLATGSKAGVTSPDRRHQPRSGDGPTRSRHVDPTRRQQAIAAWMLALPFTLLFLAFTLGPVLASFGMSFTDMRRADIRSPFAVQFIGLDNFVKLIEDPLFRKVTLNTFFYLLLGVPLTMALALAVAVLLNRITRLKGFFRVGYYLPAVTSIVAVSVVWKFLYRDNGGLFNTVLGWVGIDGPAWLDSTALALPSLVVMAAWRGFAPLMVIFLAGLQTIPKELNEAAEMDGATRLGPVPLHHAADAAAGAVVRRGDHRHRPAPVLRGGLRDDQGRPARLDPVRHLLRPRPVRLRQLRVRRRGQLPAVPGGRPAHLRAVPAAGGSRRQGGQEEGQAGQASQEGGAVMSPSKRSETLDRDTLATETIAGEDEAVLDGGDLNDMGKAPGWIYAVLGVGLFLVVMPFLWMVISSFKPEREVRAVPPTWWPETITLDNYDRLFTQLDFPTYFMNSVIVALAVTIGNMVFCSMLGYALAKLDFPGKRALFLIVLGTLMVPGAVTFVPLFVMTTKMGLANTLIGMILPFLAGPFGVFLMRQYILTLPDELIQAARIDGAGELRIFASVILPLCGPALATLGILTFLGSWNNFLWPLVVAQTEDKYTLPVALALYAVGQNATQYGLLLAGSVVVVIPVLALFLLLQRYIMQGIAMTGIK